MQTIVNRKRLLQIKFSFIADSSLVCKICNSVCFGSSVFRSRLLLFTGPILGPESNLLLIFSSTVANLPELAEKFEIGFS
jgi:hypothetical protein